MTDKNECWHSKVINLNRGQNGTSMNASNNKILLKLLVLLTFLVPSLSCAFLNIEALRLSKLDEEQSKGSFRLGLNTQNGNVNRERYKLTSLNLIKKTKNTWILMGDYLYGQTFDEEDTRQGRAHVRYTRRQNKYLEVEGYSQLQFNKFQNLNLRRLFGAGVRFEFKKEQSKFRSSFGIGGFYEFEDLEDETEIDNPRGNLYFSLHYEQKRFDLNTTFYYQPNLEEFDDYRVNLSLGIETSLGGNFFQQASYSLIKDSRPPNQIAKTDGNLMIEVGVRY